MESLLLLTTMGLLLAAVSTAPAQQQLETDTLPTSAGDLTITFVGHGSLMFAFNGKIIHVDPYSKLADYAKLPKADLILITHEHQDHLDPTAMQAVRTTNTIVLLTPSCAQQLPGGVLVTNGEVRTEVELRIEAVPAYNMIHRRGDGTPFHPKGGGNGYILTFGDRRVYVAGDTENTPEMKALKDIDVAFLPMNLPYTMTPEMVADAAKAFRPKILYPYHYGDTDTSKLTDLLKNTPGIEVRVRRMK
jgi:L-ascorbate metabolism protein UlaG (beta-lactamase superfamily)